MTCDLLSRTVVFVPCGRHRRPAPRPRSPAPAPRGSGHPRRAAGSAAAPGRARPIPFPRGRTGRSGSSDAMLSKTGARHARSVPEAVVEIGEECPFLPGRPRDVSHPLGVHHVDAPDGFAAPDHGGSLTGTGRGRRPVLAGLLALSDERVALPPDRLSRPRSPTRDRTRSSPSPRPGREAAGTQRASRPVPRREYSGAGGRRPPGAGPAVRPRRSSISSLRPTASAASGMLTNPKTGRSDRSPHRSDPGRTTRPRHQGGTPANRSGVWHVPGRSEERPGGP
jgi:hypothetical protein